MAQVPGLTGTDEATDKLPVDELGAPAAAAAVASHQAAGHNRRPPCSSSAVDWVRVLRVFASSRKVKTPPRAVALVLRGRHVLAEAEMALPRSEPKCRPPA